MALQKDTVTRGSDSQWESRVNYALRNLDDRSVLNRSPLARLTYVEKLARDRYSSHILPRGLALREVLEGCIEKVVDDLNGERRLSRICQYLVGLKQGLSCKQISSEMGLCREHVSRVYRSRALELVTIEFLSIVKRRQ
jgi:CRP-like cAMP-binding protein